jgi:hypothetical protein
VAVMDVLAWIGIALGSWVVVSVVTGFALASLIGRGSMRLTRRRDFARFGLVCRPD